MGRTKRICPVCGAGNPIDAERCRECGVDMGSNLPVPSEERPPVPWKELGTSLVLATAALGLRVGLRLLRGALEKEEKTSLLGKVRKWLPWLGREEESPASQPKVKVWGKRIQGVWRSDGATHWEVEEFTWEGKR